MMGTQVFFPRFVAFIVNPLLSILHLFPRFLSGNLGFLPSSFPSMLVTGEAILADQGFTGNAVYPFIWKSIY